MTTTRLQKLAALTLALSAIVPAACTRGAEVTSNDTAEPGAAAQANERTSATALSIEQAERKLDVGREIPGARATLEGVLRDPATTPEQRDQANLALSRVLSAEGNREGATRAVEALLAEHGADERAAWSLRGAAEARLRKLVTGSEVEPVRRERRRSMPAFPYALTRYFPKAEPGREIDVKIFAFGGDSEVSDRLGTFDIARALREERKDACPLCVEHLDINNSVTRSGGWIGIPMHRPRLGAALAVYYFDLGEGRIPARYDAELPIPSSEIVSHLERGVGLIAARERPGAPPVILIAAPRRAQLEAVEQALAMKQALPSSPEAVEVPVPAKLQRSEISEVVRAAFPSYRGCYEELLKRNPDAAGTMPLKFTIQLDGTVTDLAIDQAATLRDATFSSCMLAAIGALVFPATPEKATITYPIACGPARFFLGPAK